MLNSVDVSHSTKLLNLSIKKFEWIHSDFLINFYNILLNFSTSNGELSPDKTTPFVILTGCTSIPFMLQCFQFKI